jgi:hypothetical protein
MQGETHFFLLGRQATTIQSMKVAGLLLLAASGLGAAMAQQSQGGGATFIHHDDDGAVLELNHTTAPEMVASGDVSKTQNLRVAQKVRTSGEPAKEWERCPQGMAYRDGVGCVPNEASEHSQGMVGPTAEEKVADAENRAKDAEQRLEEYVRSRGEAANTETGGATGGQTGGENGGATGGETGGATGAEDGGDTGALEPGAPTGSEDAESKAEWDAAWAAKTPTKQYKDGGKMIMQHDPSHSAYDYNGTYKGINTAKTPLPEGTKALPTPSEKCCRICGKCKDEDKDEEGNCLEEFQLCETVCGEQCDVALPPPAETTEAPATPEEAEPLANFDASHVVITDEMKKEVSSTPLAERVQKISQLLRAASAKAKVAAVADVSKVEEESPAGDAADMQ